MATYTDQFFVIDPGAPPPSGTALTVQNYSYDDVNNDGFISTTAGDTFNGQTVTSVWVGDTITVFVPGVGTVTITGVTFYLSSGPAVFTPTDGTILQDATFQSSSYVSSSTQVAVGTLFPTCFTLGTLIETERGPQAIETLREGDMIVTQDNGLQPLRWVSRSTVRAVGNFAPVRIKAGALGNHRDLIVSQQHRMLLSGWRAELLYGTDEVLVAAKHLIDGKDVHLVEGGSVTYLHLMFDQHEIVMAEGIASESYYAGHAVADPTHPAAAEVLALFPELRETPITHLKTARCVLRGYEAMLLAA